MFIFHEGLPGSGKSYEAMVKHVIPTLEKGQHVYSNINGIEEGAPKIAEILQKPLKEVINMIHHLTDDDVKEVYTLKDIPDILVVLDELQDYWPSDLRKLDPEIRSYIAKHEHYGHNIIGMGQNLGGCNKAWRNRCARKITFMKRDMIGRPNEYTWTSYQGKLQGESSEVVFIKLKSDGEVYDSTYFGTYKSTESDVENVRVNYEDDRTNLLKSKWLKIIPILMLIVSVFVVYTLYNVFFGDTFAEAAEESFKPEKTVQKTVYQPPEKKVDLVEVVQKPVYKPVDYFDEIAATSRLRLSAVIYDETGQPTLALIDAYKNNDLIERFYLNDVRTLGWNVENRVYGLLLSKSELQYVVRSWPIENKSSSSSTMTPLL